MKRKKKIIDFDSEFMSGQSENKGISVITDYDAVNEDTFFSSEIDDVLPVLPLRNMVLFPTVIMPVSIGRRSSLELIEDVARNKGLMAVVCQKDSETDLPGYSDLYEIGTVAKIIRVFDMPDGSTSVILQGLQRVRVTEITEKVPYLKGTVEELKEVFPEKGDVEYDLLVENCKDTAVKFLTDSENHPDATFTVKNMKNALLIINFLCVHVQTKVAEKMEMLKLDSLKDRAYKLLTFIKREIEIVKIRQNIEKKTSFELDKQQREYYLQQMMKNIQEELGGTPQEIEINEMRYKSGKKKWNNDVAAVFEKEISKLERMNVQSPDYNVQLNYLQMMLSLPWGEYTEDNLDMKNAQRVLDKDHYGLDKVKERILEHLAVIKMRGDMKAPILCLYGPPGVGKTSLGKSIAAALKRKCVRMSLGGVHDESEIRGHRRTYIGAMCGRILKNIIKAGTDNPVFILDEIDKVGHDATHGDPASALLEVLDPEQNNAFHDNYLDMDYDLSKVLFIATANNLNTIPSPLLDRMELIEVSGYLTEEKVEIARHHLIPDEMEANGISGEKITIRKNTIEKIVEEYTRESGVRELKKKIGKVCRRLACQKAVDEDFKTPVIKPEHVKELLGVQEFSREKYQGNEYAGVVVGLAWTAVGGEILFIETSVSRGKEGKLTITGNLGDVMKESAMLALEYVKSHADMLEIPIDLFENWNIHLHVPEGAIPKDGPSAGITMATAIASALTQRRVKAHLAMTGEITLRGKVLPVGGIKEKILAAKRAGIKEIILCAENKRNIEEIPDKYLEGLDFHYVTDVCEVFEIALLKEKVKDPINFSQSEI